MTLQFNKTRLLISCLFLSVLVHILSFYAWRLLGTYDFNTPVTQTGAVVVDLAKLDEKVPQTEISEEAEVPEIDGGEPDEEESKSETQPSLNAGTPPLSQEQLPPSPRTGIKPDSENKNSALTRSNKTADKSSSDKLSQNETANLKILPLSDINDFLGTKNEKLTYLVSMFGVPVGSAELDVKNEKGEIRLTLRVTSNAAISSIFPVDDVVETRHIGGRFIMTNIKQHEGSFRSDEGFTVNIIKKRVSWYNNVTGRSLLMTIPTGEILDTLSGIYFLRTRQLEVGKTEILHIFDSEAYAEVPVEILLRETMRLPNLQKVDTLVIRPLQKTAGIFRRTGDILIWMTDDANKVPVKIITSVALGTVTIELVSAESTPQETEAVQNR